MVAFSDTVGVSKSLFINLPLTHALLTIIIKNTKTSSETNKNQSETSNPLWKFTETNEYERNECNGSLQFSDLSLICLSVPV